MRRFEHGGNIYEARERHPGLDIVDFSANINALGMSPQAIEAYHDAILGIGAYPDPKCTALIRGISEHFSIDGADVIVGNGAIDLMHGLAGELKLDKVMVVGPTFVEYEKLFELAGTTVVFGLSCSKDNYRSDLTAIARTAIGEGAQGMVLCNPNNPTGVLYTRAEVEELLEFCKLNDLWLIYDEAFMDFADECASLLNKVADYPRLAVFRSFTKFYAIPGLRSGCLVTSNPAVKDNMRMKSIPWSVNHVAQTVTIAGLKDEEYRKATLSFHESERSRMYRLLSGIESINVYSPSANYVFFEEKVSSTGRLKTWLEEKGVLIRHCDNYVGLRDGCYRVAVRSTADNDGLLEYIKEFYDNESIQSASSR